MTAPQTFQKKPVRVRAIQWDGTAQGASAIIDWILANGGTARYECSDPDRCARHDGDCPHYIAIETLEGTMRASHRDFVIEGVQNEFYPCKPDIFEATYDQVENVLVENVLVENVLVENVLAQPDDYQDWLREVQG